jgi:hypothetical protein
VVEIYDWKGIYDWLSDSRSVDESDYAGFKEER